MFGACGGKAAGKGNGKKQTPEGGRGHLQPRERLSSDKFTGTVIAWKGKYGWIQAAEEIEHEKASLHGGCLWVSTSDVQSANTGDQTLTPGAPCTFHIYEDASALGAEEVDEIGPPDPDFVPPAKGKGKGAPAGGSAPMANSAGQVGFGGFGGGGFAGCAKGFKGAAMCGKGAAMCGKGCAAGFAAKGGCAGKFGGGAKGVIQTITKTPFGMQGMQGMQAKGKAKGGSKPKKLERTRISEAKFMGTVAAWRGKFGFINPAEAIDHPKASLHSGALYTTVNDLIDCTELTVGQDVEFHIFEDESGIGAEEVVPL